MSDEFQDMWQAQNPERPRIPLEEIRSRAEKMQNRMKWRNAREYIAAAVVAIVFAIQTWTAHDPISRTGCALLVVSSIYIVYQLRARGSSREITGDCLEFHRRELERQRDLANSVWKWYLGPMMPGLLLIPLGSIYDHRGARHPAFLVAYVVLLGAAFYATLKLNQRGARCLQRQIDELDRMR